MANEQRGEVEITLGGKDYILAPSFEAIAAIERRTGRGIYGLANKWIGERDIGMRDAATVIEECIRAGGVKPPEKIGELIRADGLNKFVMPLIKLISNAIRGDEQPGDGAGEDKAAIH